jgi:hypothetical protein
MASSDKLAFVRSLKRLELGKMFATMLEPGKQVQRSM